ncbi:MAG: hypothetical protein OEZ65_04910 [Gemmatimonadota bacterium]|nr:hypothetical protein [Gemmatimonadota bacterium]MDH5758907.1 hypothetical protein [Gemmatimonadota bacterium]
MPVGSYAFRTGVSAFFEMATEDAVAALPRHLQPIEVRHQRSVLSVTAFLFDESEVGPYTELMLSVVVPPMVGSWLHHAKAGFYPFLAATSSEEARRRREERFHFPYLDEDIDAQFIETGDRLTVRAWVGGDPLLDLSVTQYSWESTTHVLQGFMMNGEERLRTTLQISGEYTMHENERGSINLYPHPLIKDVFRNEMPSSPFREHWFKNGREVFHSLEAF